jgi:hypothetical protein
MVRRSAAVAAVILSGMRQAQAQSAAYNEPNTLPTASLYGGMGLLDMRNARFMPDGYLALNVDVKKPDNRIALTFQAFPWLEASFRYTINYALPPVGQRALYDRSFDLKFRLFTEGEYTPQVAVGFQDVIGTGVYSAEYLVASKSYGPLDFTTGMGWGRLASNPTFANPLGYLYSGFNTRPGDTSTTGGTPLASEWFRGPDVGIFGGIEYKTPIPNLTFKAEYSSDAYTHESTYHQNGVTPTNYAPLPVNVGLSYRFFSNLDLGLAYMNGRFWSADLTIALNPNEPNWAQRLDPPPLFVARPDDSVGSITQLHLSMDQAGDGDSAIVNHIDLTALPSADGRPLDPAFFHAGQQRVMDAFQKANLHVTDGWIDGKRLVAQIDMNPQGDVAGICSRLTIEGSLPAPEVVLVGADWNPIAICGGANAAPSSAARTAAPVQTATEKWPANVLDGMRKAIEEQKISVIGITIAHGVVKAEIENQAYYRDTEAVYRTLQALSTTAPADIIAFEITTSFAHMPLTTVTVPRTQVDGYARQETTPAEMWASSILADAKPDTDIAHGESDPRFSWSIFPSLSEDLFDPNNPAYVGIGISGSTQTELLPGLVLDDQATYSVFNNFGNITRPSDSLLPHVRSDVAEYLKDGSTGIDDLTLSYYRKLTSDVYAHVTAGYIETMFAGAGGEVLYRPFGQRWALGADADEVYQRDFDDLFGVQGYHVLTGHISLYVETPWEDVTAIVRGGRYLAGDYGATFELYRRFDTGIIVGAWFTLTNVSSKQFGEGSFDKGIRIVIPTEWALPFGTTTQYELDLRPTQRDGGQPLDNATTLYDMTQPSSYGDLQRQWPHLFQ